MEITLDPNELENLTRIITELEEIELQEQDETKGVVYKKLMMYYLMEDQPIKAKLLWKRIPKQLKTDSNSELNHIWSLSQFLLQRKYKHVFDFSIQLKRTNHQWSEPSIEFLFKRVIELSRDRLFELLNFAYSTISVQELANLLSTSTEEAIGLALKQDWTIDASRTLLMPKKTQKADIAEIPNQLQMQQLTSLVSFLET